LRDEATLLRTAGIELNAGTLVLDNNASLQTQLSDRLSDTAPVTLRSGSLILIGRNKVAATETLGNVIAATGANTLMATPTGNTGASYFSAALTLTSLTRNAGATLNFVGANLGLEGNTSHIYLTQIPTLPVPGVLGAWAIHNSSDYASVNGGGEIGALGQGGYGPYDGLFGYGKVTNSVATAAGLAAGTLTLAAGTTTTGLLRIGGAYTNDLAFPNPGAVLNLQFGGLLRSNDAASTTIGTTARPGTLTAGG
jgi:hypothetical protein